VAFADMWGLPVTVVEIFDQILPGVTSPGLARMAQKHMEDKDVVFHLGEQVARIEGEDGKVTRVVTDKGTIEADLVIVSVGVTPNSQIAKDAGLHVSARGGIIVDTTMRTSDPDIFAGGDCVEVKNLVTDQPMFLPLGSMANRQGRVIGDNLAGGDSRFPGVVGSWCVKLFDLGAAGTGLTLAGAKRAGIDAVATHVTMVDRAHFYPEHQLMSLELVAERSTRRVLGVQGLGASGDALVGKINTVAALLPHKPTVSDISNVEVAYSPPFASAMDILNTLGNAADNILTGQNKGLTVSEFESLWRDGGDDIYFLDCREWGDAGKIVEGHPDRWHNIPQGELRERLAEVPRDKKIVLMCNTGARSYEALVTLVHMGFNDVRSVEGGMAATRASGVAL